MKQASSRVILLISLLGAGAMGYWMWRMHQSEVLWGYRPLVLFLFLFTSFLLLFGRSLMRDAQRMRWLGYTLASGLLLSLAFPPLPLSWLTFVGFVPLLMVEQELSSQNQPRSGRLLLSYSFCGFIFWNILATYWVANTAFVAGVFAIVANSLLMSIPFILFHKSKKVLSPALATLAFIAYWITFEYLHMRWELSWPWLTLGNAFSSFPAGVQWYEITGVFGGSLWALLVNVLFFKIWLQRKAGAPFASSRFIKPGVLIGLPMVISLILYFFYTEKGPAKEVVVVQPNYEPHYQKFETPDRLALKHFFQLSKNQLTDSTDYLVFPETSFGGIRQNKLPSDRIIKDLQRFVDGYSRLHLVSGVGAQRIFEPGEPLGEAARVHIMPDGDTLYWESYNAAVQLSSGKKEVPIYLKSILVPGAENFPYRKFLFFLQPVVDALQGSTGLGRQAGRAVFYDGKLAVGPVICYESIFGEYTTGYVHKGANALFIVTNDGWWSNTSGHKQHLAYARLRAIETRRSIARSANTGISAFINQRGDVLQPTDYSTAAAIRGKIQFNDAITFYVRWGDLIGRVALFATIILLLNTIAKGWLRRAKEKGRGK